MPQKQPPHNVSIICYIDSMAAELLLPAAIFVVIAGLARWALSRPTPVPDAHQAALASTVARHARKRAVIAGFGALVVAATLLCASLPLAKMVAGTVGPDGPTGLSYALTPLAVGLVFALVFLLAEHTWPRPTHAVRSATLRRRSLTDFSPRWLLTITATWAASLVTLLTWAGSVASGTMLRVSYENEDGSFGWMGAGPFPGSSYGIPTLAGTAILITTAWFALREIRRRPAMAGLEATMDDALRRSSARQLLGVTQAALGLTLSGNLFAISSALQSVSHLTTAVILLILSLGTGVTSLAGVGLSFRRP